MISAEIVSAVFCFKADIKAPRKAVITLPISKVTNFFDYSLTTDNNYL